MFSLRAATQPDVVRYVFQFARLFGQDKLNNKEGVIFSLIAWTTRDTVVIEPAGAALIGNLNRGPPSHGEEEAHPGTGALSLVKPHLEAFMLTASIFPKEGLAVT